VLPPVMLPVSEEGFHVKGRHDGTLILVFIVSVGGLAQRVAEIGILAKRLLGLLDRGRPIGLNGAHAVAIRVEASLTNAVCAKVVKDVTEALAHVVRIESTRGLLAEVRVAVKLIPKATGLRAFAWWVGRTAPWAFAFPFSFASAVALAGAFASASPCAFGGATGRVGRSIPVATVVEGMRRIHVRALAAAECVRALQVGGHGRAGAAAAPTRGRGRAALLLHILRLLALLLGLRLSRFVWLKLALTQSRIGGLVDRGVRDGRDRQSEIAERVAIELDDLVVRLVMCEARIDFGQNRFHVGGDEVTLAISKAMLEYIHVDIRLVGHDDRVLCSVEIAAEAGLPESRRLLLRDGVREEGIELGDLGLEVMQPLYWRLTFLTDSLLDSVFEALSKSCVVEGTFSIEVVLEELSTERRRIRGRPSSVSVKMSAVDDFEVLKGVLGTKHSHRPHDGVVDVLSKFRE
jgi:hypothetical protein